MVTVGVRFPVMVVTMPFFLLALMGPHQLLLPHPAPYWKLPSFFYPCPIAPKGGQSHLRPQNCYLPWRWLPRKQFWWTLNIDETIRPSPALFLEGADGALLLSPTTPFTVFPNNSLSVWGSRTVRDNKCNKLEEVFMMPFGH